MAQSTCTIDDCDKEAKAPKGWCWLHYGRWRRNGDPLALFVQQPCSVPDCILESRASGMCDKHYCRVKRHGDPLREKPVYGLTCMHTDCSRPSRQAGMCGRHYYMHWTTEGRGLEVTAAANSARRARLSNAPVVERGLSWRSLWADGLRFCYLCGVTCSTSDFYTKTNRAGREQHINGPTYPTLDHIQALARGGSHTRANAGLACARCNSRKHTKGGHETQQCTTGPGPSTHSGS
jgi:5-methylcytosine-specific restriction endonuclease McrA